MKNLTKLLIILLLTSCSINDVLELPDKEICECELETRTYKVVYNNGIVTSKLSIGYTSYDASCEQDGQVISGSDKVRVQTIKCKTIN